MLNELNGIVNPTLRERIDKSIVGKLINAKVNFGLGALVGCSCKGKRKILKCTDELAEDLNKPLIRTFQRRKVNVSGVDEIWAADLIDIPAFSKDNNGINYLLTVIDIFSKLVWIVPLKRKTGQEVERHFRRSSESEDLVKCG